MDIDKKIRTTPGLILSLLVIGIPTFAWLIGFDFSNMSSTEIVGTTMEKTAGFAGMAMFAWSLILSGRYKIIDTLFHGMDKVYIAHRFFGTACLAILLTHPLGNTIVWAFSNNPGIIGAAEHFFEFSTFGVLLGRISLYGLVLVGLWSIFIRVKHETFVAIHRWLGVLFIIGALHAFAVGSTLAANPFLWWYMLILSTLATLTFVHFSLLADFLHPFYKFEVTYVENLPGNVTDIRLKPKYRIPNFKPGQFFYISFASIDEHLYHPFSIASSKNSSEFRFLVKQLGDHTTAMRNLKPGTNARVKGPYGGFTFNDKKHPKQLWIAGGIGITPFLSKAYSLRFSRMTPEVTMFHAARNEKEVIDRDQLDLIEEHHRAFDYKYLCEDEFGIISLKDIVDQIGSLEDYAIYLCGPPPMLRAYAQQAEELGLENQLYFEEFTY